MDRRLFALLVVGMFVGVLTGCPPSEPVEVPEDAPQLVEPDEVELTAPTGEGTTGTAEFENVGGSTLDVDIQVPQDHAAWLRSVEPADFEVDPGENAEVELQAICIERADVYSVDLLVETNDPRLEEFIWTVTLTCEQPAAGQLTVGIEGLDDDVDADVNVTGPGDFEETVTATTTFDEAEPGNYQITANTAGDDEIWYEPDVAEQTVELGGGDDIEATVEYAGVPGDVHIEIDGSLPEGAQPAIELLDADGELVASQSGEGTFENVGPGDHVVAPRPHETDDGAVYRANDQDITILSDETTEVTVDYLVEIGRVVVDVQFEPEDEGLDHDIELVGDVTYEVPQTGQLNAVEPGSYTLKVDRVDDGGLRAFDANDIEDVVVESGEETELEVVYRLVSGQLEVEITGAPGGGDVTVDGPGIEGDEGEITDTTVFGDLEPGTYAIGAAGISDNSDDYSPTIYDEQDEVVADGEFDVASGDQRVATVEYDIVPGTLDVTVEWVDDHDQVYGGVDADIQIEGPDGEFETHLTESDNLEVDPGDYTFTVGDVWDGEETAKFEWSSDDLDGDEVTVNSSQPTEVTVSYTVVDGDLHVSAENTEGNDWSATVSGPDGFEKEIEEAEPGEIVEFDEVLPGQYLVEFEQFDESTDVDRRYVAADEQAVFASDEDDWQLTGDYDAQPGRLTVDMNGLPDVDGAGEPVEIDFRLDAPEGIDDRVVSYDGSSTDQQAIVETAPGVYELQLDGDDESNANRDTWGNAFNIDGLGDIEVHSRGIEEVTHSLEAPLPTEVLTEGDAVDEYGTLRNVVDRVEPYSEITFAEGVDDIALDERIPIDKPFALFGDGVTVSLAEDPEAENGLFDIAVVDEQFEADEVYFQGFELREGIAETGGAVYVSTDVTDATFFDVDFIDNTATGDDGGGAIGAEAPDGAITVAIHEGQFDENVAESGSGGAIGAGDGIELEVTETEFIDNEADTDGGALDAAGSLTVERTEFVGNLALDFGGALSASGDSVIGESHFESNSASDGGGAVDVREGAHEIRRVLFEQNQVFSRSGGAIHSVDTELNVLNSTFSGNEALEGGGGVFFREDVESRIGFSTFAQNDATLGGGIKNRSETNDIVLFGTFFVDNAFPGENEIETHGDPVQSAGHNVVRYMEDGDIEERFEAEGTDIVNEPTDYVPVLQDWGGFTEVHPLVPGEHGYLDVDADDCRDLQDELISTDQREFPRPAGNACSRGGWEVDAHREDFERAEFDETASSGTFEGVDDREWSYDQVFAVGDYDIAGPGARFDTTGARIASVGVEAVEDDVEAMSVQFRKAGDDADARRITVEAGDQEVTSDQFGDEEGVDETVRVLTVDDIDAGSEIEVTIKNDSPDGSGDITIDNVTWR